MKRALFTWTTALLVTAGTTTLAGGPALAAAHAAGVTASSETECSTAYFDNNSLLGPVGCDRYT